MRANVEIVLRVIEVGGIAIILIGATLATAVFLRGVLARGLDVDAALVTYRQRLGQSILLGLEFLVAADIIGTVAVDPTLESVTVLGAIVLIRTFLSTALNVEIEGRWPWQKAAAAEREGRGTT